MTVRELIRHLETLEQDRGIWVFYDGGYSIFAPVPDTRADEYDQRESKGVKVGDYIITAG